MPLNQYYALNHGTHRPERHLDSFLIMVVRTFSWTFKRPPQNSNLDGVVSNSRNTVNRSWLRQSSHQFLSNSPSNLSSQQLKSFASNISFFAAFQTCRSRFVRIIHCTFTLPGGPIEGPQGLSLFFR